MLRRTARQVRKSIELRGVLGTARFVAERAARRIGGEKEAAFQPNQAEEDSFDKTFGVDTSGTVPLSALEIQSSNWIHGVCYGGTERGTFEEIFDGVELRFEDNVFVDLGSGKGKALLLASHFPFKKVIGVEFSDELHRVAVENLRRYAAPQQRCKDLTSICADATAFAYPEENLVVYLYHPFGEAVMAPVIENLKRSVKQTPRDLVVVYNNPLLGKLWEDAGFVKLKHRIDLNYAVFRLPR